MLFCEYINWTGDLEAAHHYWPNIVAAISWLDNALIDGYIWYQRESDKGLENQGWKDSGDSVMHVSGALADPPIAICEAQAYIYAAKDQLARIAELVGHSSMAAKLKQDAAEMKERFQRDFWLESEDFISMALDGHGKPVGVLSSNPGHCLWTGILDNDKAQLVADRLMSEDLYSGWGIRTLGQSSIAFNPMSYHNGSVWPHDNAIIAEGMRKIGRTADAHKIMKAMYDVARHESEFRLPELFCGFERNEAYRPINYPVSCSPQAWAAGAMFQMLKACINFEPDACSGRLKIVEPHLPDWLGRVTIRGLRIGGAMLDLTFNTQDGNSVCQILKKSGNVRIIVEG
jgi:glycogen debranching enzyme